MRRASGSAIRSGSKTRVVEVDETALKAGTHHGSTFYEHQRFNAARARRQAGRGDARRTD